MPLLSESDRQTVRSHLAAISHRVTILFFTQTFDAPETVLIAKQVIDEVASLNDQVSVEEVNLILDKERAAQFGVDRVPAIALLRDDEDTRIRFLGAPAGYEFTSLVEAVLLAGTGDSGLTAESRTLIAERATGAIDIKVFVTPTCPHCPRAVTMAHRMAVASPHIRATCVEATENIDLAQKYQVTGVPKTIVEGTAVELLGALPEDAFVTAVLGGPPDETGKP
jgi:glutaredoxin-like protein